MHPWGKPGRELLDTSGTICKISHREDPKSLHWGLVLCNYGSPRPSNISNIILYSRYISYARTPPKSYPKGEGPKLKS